MPHFETPEVAALNEREVLVQKIRGKEMHIPNLKLIFEGWRGITTLVVNPCVDQLRQRISAHLRTLKLSPEKIKHLEAADFGFCGAVWWPDAPLDRLETMTGILLWLFLWDDELDEPGGFFTDDYNSGEAYRNETLKFAGLSLGSIPEDPKFNTSNRIIRSFGILASALRTFYDETQCKRVFDEMAQYMLGTQTEQQFRMLGNIPTFEDFWRYRLGASAVSLVTAFTEYSLLSRIPSQIMESEAMQAIWTETNVLIFSVNDILSFRKEIGGGCINNLITVIWASAENPETVIPRCMDELRASRERFDQAADELMVLAEQYDCSDEVHRFIETQKSNCVGNLIWSLQTKRYRMAESLNADGSATFIP